ncbi:MAG: hypothetical protein LBS60_06135 [Deltaproteobacteria bacterium]|jgi:flavodoxin|nr:hypothetical protein [Deltaproteobacteria bacterium]
MKKALWMILLAAIVALIPFPAPTVASPNPLRVKDPANNPGPFGRALVICYSQTGITENLAEIIRAKVNGDLINLEVNVDMPREEKAIIQEMEKRQDEPLTIKNPPPNLDGYDVIFVGGPVWYGEIAQPLASFLANIDFQGKKVVVFGTSGSAPREAYAHLAQSLKNAQVVPGGRIFGREVLANNDHDELVSAWLTTIKTNF